MFGRLTNVTLKNAETALAEGRLDAAHDLLLSPELAGHKRGIMLLAGLFEPLLHRAQDHLLAGRFREALLDIERAARCGVKSEKIGEWRQRAISAMEQYNQKLAEQRHALDAAAAGLARGDLTLAGAHVERLAPELPEKARLTLEIDAKARRSNDALDTARQALKAEHFGAAVEAILAAQRDHAGVPEARELARAAIERLTAHARTVMTSGQIDRARHDLALALRLEPENPDVLSVERAVRWADDARVAIRDARYDDAFILMGKFVAAIPDARWAVDVREHLKEVDNHLRALAEGPLGLLTSGPGVARTTERAATDTMTGAGRRTPANLMLAPPVPLAPPVLDPIGVPRRMLLRIDGVGSFLLLRGERWVIGRTGLLADLPLVSDLSERHAEILRTNDDYFLIGDSAVEVGGQPVRQALLSHGDRIRLGRRMRMTFERPSRKSPSAVLALGEGVRSLADVRRAILWAGPILIGGTTDCHIPLRGGMPGLVLLDKAGTIQLRPMPGAGGLPALSGPVNLTMGQPFDVGAMRLTLQVVES